jgi:hypothetical protein
MEQGNAITRYLTAIVRTMDATNILSQGGRPVLKADAVRKLGLSHLKIFLLVILD